MTVLKPEELFDRLREGVTVVTGNSRLARVLSAQYGQWRMGQGERQWRSPAVLSWNAWVGKLWDTACLQGAVEGAVPGNQQLLNLWETALAADEQAKTLLRRDALAGQAAETRRLLVEWSVNRNHPAWTIGNQGNENHKAFLRWSEAFENACDQRGWTPPEDRLPVLSRAAREGGFKPRGPILLLGFDEFSPAQQAFLDAIRSAGTEADESELPPAAGRAVLWKSADSRDELEGMARWVRMRQEAAPGAAIGVVSPDLGSRRQEIERQLRAILAPKSIISDAGADPWNISMGVPLSSVPVVTSAFDLLRLVTINPENLDTDGANSRDDGRIDIQDAGRVLHSPWINGGVLERGNRALLEKRLRDEYPRRFKLTDLRFCAGQQRLKDRHGQELPQDQQGPQPWNSPGMEQITGKLVRFRGDNRSADKLPSAWAEAIDGLLASVGWPHGDGAELAGDHDSNWQAFQHWQEALRELSSLDTTSGPVTFSTAVHRLMDICGGNVFQPRTPPANIQVLGLYEAIGLRFDHLWVLGLHNDNWPPPARRNPFIPAAIQLEAGLPNSGPQRELEVARRISSRLMESSPDCVFSYPGQVDGEETLSSPLLATDGIVNIDRLDGWDEPDWRTTIFSHGGVETVQLEDPGPLNGETARGGTSILKNQAACPFRAFAVNRLGAEGLAAPADGITPMLHGTLVHEVLEEFWRETASLNALQALDDNSLRGRLQNHVDAVLSKRYDMKSRPAFRGVEAQRILRLALDYLELEKTRAPFRVTGFEQEINYEIEGQGIRLVIDRIDRLPTGGEIIIDYKTGGVKPDKWFGDPMEEPQLPLYAASAEQPPAAVVYAVIRNDGCEYKGIVQQPGLFPGLPKPGKASEYLDEAGRNLPGTTNNWRQVLHRLMSEFLEGKAEIQPLQGETSCKNVYCDLQPLCRIGELKQRRDRPPTITEGDEQ